jgi:2-keto-4-pentenoate hydratase/2-oxohepta-3-ene-1,7-dioic acid hydratase in catechol pathway
MDASMRVFRHQSEAGPALAYELDGYVIDAQLLLRDRLIGDGLAADSASRIATGLLPSDIGDLFGIARGNVRAYLSSLNVTAITSDDERRGDNIILDVSKLNLLPPLAREGIVYAVGRNYAAHVAEAGREIPDIPSVFIRTPQSIVGAGQTLLRPSVSKELDWEGELAVHIGTPFRLASPENALQHVAGYSVFNDGSVRDYQHNAPILTAGKNFYRSGSCGPCIVTSDVVEDAQGLQLTTYVNGEVMQDANTEEMIFNIGQVLSYISEFTVLRPGDVVATGTPAGVGSRQSPPRWLRDGDELKIQISSIGVLTNTVKDEAVSE